MAHIMAHGMAHRMAHGMAHIMAHGTAVSGQVVKADLESPFATVVSLDEFQAVPRGLVCPRASAARRPAAQCFAFLCFSLLCFALLCFALLCFALLPPRRSLRPLGPQLCLLSRERVCFGALPLTL
jgi:hypothetical protein